MSAVIASAEIEEIAENLMFAESEGGPLIALPDPAAASWWGVFGQDGEVRQEGHHYDRACDASDAALLSVGEYQAIVLATPDATAFYPLPDGGLLLRWVGADTAAGVAAAMLAVNKDAWIDTGNVLQAPGGRCRIMDSADDGRQPPSDMVAFFELPAGRYRLETTDEQDVQVQTSAGVEDVMANAVRLRRL